MQIHLSIPYILYLYNEICKTIFYLIFPVRVVIESDLINYYKLVDD
jgi:hypothetical protein